jgi:hypothetical protein
MSFEKWMKDRDPYYCADDDTVLVRKLKLAYEAGVRAGYKEAERDSRDVAAEAGWKERQGEEYGSY